MFEWTQEMRIDDGQIDEEHKQLFVLANRIFSLDHPARDEDELKQIIRDLYDYVKYHFDREERLMKDLKYPLFEAHQERHRQIINGMNVALTQSLHMSALLKNFRDIVGNWVVDHIMIEDKKIQKYFLDKKGI